MTIALLLLLQVQVGSTSTDFADRVMDVAVSPDGRRLILGRWGGAVELWDLQTNTRVHILLKASGQEYGPKAEKVLFHPDGKSVFAAGFGIGVRRWPAEGGAATWTLSEAKNPLALSPDTKLLAVGLGFKGGLILWNLTHGRRETALEGHRRSIGSVAFSPDGKRLYSGSQDRTARAWDVATGKELWRLGEESDDDSIGPAFPHCVAPSPDGRWLAVSYHGCFELGLKLVDADTGNVVATTDVGHSDAVAFHPKEGLLALQGGDDHIYLWDVAKRRRTSRSPSPHKNRVFGMAWTPDGTRLITAGSDSLILVWDPSRFDTLDAKK